MCTEAGAIQLFMSRLQHVSANSGPYQGVKYKTIESIEVLHVNGLYINTQFQAKVRIPWLKIQGALHPCKLLFK